jgi:hypothetical protein
VIPPVALLQAPDLGLGGAGGEGERRVPRVQLPGVRHLVRQEGAAHAGPLRVPEQRDGSGTGDQAVALGDVRGERRAASALFAG